MDLDVSAPAPPTPGRGLGYLWVASYPDGGRRKSRHVDPKRNYARLMPTKSLIDALGGSDAARLLLQDLGGGAGSTSRRNPIKCTARGMLQVSEQDAKWHDGILTQWHPLIDVQRKYYDDPLDCYTLKIEDSLILDPPTILHHRRLERSGTGGASKTLTPERPLIRAVWDGTELQGNALLRFWDFEGRLAFSNSAKHLEEYSTTQLNLQNS